MSPHNIPPTYYPEDRDCEVCLISEHMHSYTQPNAEKSIQFTKHWSRILNYLDHLCYHTEPSGQKRQ